MIKWQTPSMIQITALSPPQTNHKLAQRKRPRQPPDDKDEKQKSGKKQSDKKENLEYFHCVINAPPFITIPKANQ